MISRLFFKGDKNPASSGKVKKVKKLKKKAMKAESIQTSLDVEKLQTSWITAISTADLKGPIVIAFNTAENDVISVLGVDSIGNITKSTDVSFQETLPISLEKIDLESKIHRVEPDDVSQVFVGVKISGVLQSNDGNRVKLALKGIDGRYLSKDSNQLSCNSEAIGDSQMWEFELVETKDGISFKLYNNGQKLSIKDDVISLVDVDSDENDLFVIRVQLKNSATGKKFLSETQNKGDNDTELMKNAVDSLYKMGINVTPETIKRLQNAADAGKMNEQLIIEKQNGKSDSRC